MMLRTGVQPNRPAARDYRSERVVSHRDSWQIFPRRSVRQGNRSLPLLLPAKEKQWQNSQMDKIIKAIDEEIKRLQQVRKLLARPNRAYVEKAVAPKRRGKPRKKLSAAARAKIAAAQRRRWAKQKRQAEKAPF